jgi:uncharacterized protein
VIYHIVGEADLRSGRDGAVYRPASLAVDGFVHCSLEASVISVANDYYRDAQHPLLLLQIDPWGLTAETKYEAAAPPPGADLTHLDSSPVFPHVYGPIDLAAIDGVGVLARTADGYAWPKEFFPIDVALSRQTS